MHEAQRALQRRVREVRIILFHLVGHQHAFIDHRLVGQTADVKLVAALNARSADAALRQFADDVELALEREVVGQFARTRDEHLPHHRFGRDGGLSQRTVLGRHGPPAEQAQAFGGDDLFKELFAFVPFRGAGGQKDQAHAVFARPGQGNLHFAAGFLEERVGHLQQNARAVAGVDLAAARAAMFQIQQHLQRLLNDGVRSSCP